MKSTLWLVSLCATAVLLAACGGEAYTYPVPGGSLNTPGGGTGTNYPTANWNVTTDAIITAGNEQQSPTAVDCFNGYIPLGHLGCGPVTRGYEFTTPANKPFAFSVLALEDGNSGSTMVKVGHSLPAYPTGHGAESIFEEGMSLEGGALIYGGSWWQATGDGASRLEVRGTIIRSQVLVFQTSTSQGTEVLAVRLKIGGNSDINIVNWQTSPATTKSRTPIFSSDEKGFGLPAIAVSGDRYSVTAYDRDSSNGHLRRWLQYDDSTSTVTGGESVSLSPDSGQWRDQEIAALNNVLAIAYTGNDAVRVEISLDRGASFAIEQVLNEYSAVTGQRLVQIEIAQDYTIAVAYWRTYLNGTNYTSELCLVEATPTGFDSNGTPTGYSFAAPTIVHSENAWVVPIVMDIEYSSAGDLVIGYGFNMWQGFSLEMDVRCMVRTSSGVLDMLIDQDIETWADDPSVSLVGSGSNMKIFFAYEMRNGIHMVELTNGGATVNSSYTLPVPGAYLPSVHARMQGTQLRVDLLYLVPDYMGFSLKRSHWPDYTGMPLYNNTSSLFDAVVQQGGTPASLTVPGKLVTTVGWMGYDAVTNGDDVAIALHTETVDLYGEVFLPGTTPPAYYGTPSTPITLLPGMTGSVPAPNANDRNQLEVIVID